MIACLCAVLPARFLSRTAVALAIPLLLLAPPVVAATMTFDHGAGTYHDTDGDGFDDLYVENGITATGFIWGELTHHPKERAHVDNPSDGHFTDRLAFRFGNLFDLVSFELWPLGFECLEAVCPGYDNVVVTGLRRGQVVAEHVFSMGSTPGLFLGGSTFAGLDLLLVSTPPEPHTYTFGNSHFEIDNLVLTSANGPTTVPLPPALPVLGLGLTALWAVRRRSVQFSQP